MEFSRSGEDRLLIGLSGRWRIDGGIPKVEEVWKEMESGSPLRSVGFDYSGLTSWDSGLLAFIIKLKNLCEGAKIQFDYQGLPTGIQRLMALAVTVPKKKDAAGAKKKTSFLAQAGGEVLDFLKTAGDMLAFVAVFTINIVYLMHIFNRISNHYRRRNRLFGRG